MKPEGPFTSPDSKKVEINSPWIAPGTVSRRCSIAVCCEATSQRKVHMSSIQERKILSSCQTKPSIRPGFQVQCFRRFFIDPLRVDHQSSKQHKSFKSSKSATGLGLQANATTKKRSE